MEAARKESICESKILTLSFVLVLTTNYTDRNCSSGITCTSHRKSVYEFALFTGVISTVLVDLIQIVGDKDMRLFYHSWNGESDTGIFIRDKNIIIVEQCLVKAGFAKLDC